MTVKQKVASKLRIGNTPEERSVEMGRRRKIGWSKKTPEERRERALLMNKIRWSKKDENKNK